MAVRSEAFAGLHPIFVNDPQGPMTQVFRVKVLAEGKAVLTLQPAQIDLTSLVRGSEGLHGMAS
jgi:hypothetical protein